jgi:hypothetical protein
MTAPTPPPPRPHQAPDATPHTRDYSDETAHVVDEEITRIVDEQAERATTQLAGHRPQLDALATALLDHETLEGDDIARILATADDTVAPGDQHAGAPDAVFHGASRGGDVVVSDEHDMTLTLADRVPELLHPVVIVAPEG